MTLLLSCTLVGCSGGGGSDGSTSGSSSNKVSLTSGYQYTEDGAWGYKSENGRTYFQRACDKYTFSVKGELSDDPYDERDGEVTCKVEDNSGTFGLALRVNKDSNGNITNDKEVVDEMLRYKEMGGMKWNFYDISDNITADVDPNAFTANSGAMELMDSDGYLFIKYSDRSKAAKSSKDSVITLTEEEVREMAKNFEFYGVQE